MSDHSQIQWTDATWNPTTGCTKVSPGCANCYIERTPAFRIHGRKFVKGATDLQLHENRLGQPLHWRKPRRVFVNSLSDLFHQDVPDAFIDRVFAVMASASTHTFQVLTKRPDRMRAYMQRVSAGAGAAGTRYDAEMRAHFERYKQEFREGYSIPEPPTPELRFIYDSAARQEKRLTSPDGTTLQAGFSGGEFHWRPWPLSNVWLGVSVENQHFADERIPLLLQTPAAVRFISAEPLIERVDVGSWLGRKNCGACYPFPCPSGRHGEAQGIDWVIVGGESGPKSRPCDIAWVRSIVAQCQAAGVPCFVKQLGARLMDSCHNHRDWPADTRAHVGATMDAPRWIQLTKKGGVPTEWPEDLRVRQFPEVRA